MDISKKDWKLFREKLSDFSDELQNEVKRILEMSR